MMKSEHWKQKTKKEFAAAGICVVVTIFLIVLVYKLWERDIHVPVCFQNDGLGAVAMVKGIIEGHGIWDRPYWSAPFGESSYMVDYWFPLLLIRILVLFSKDVGIVINSFWILTYILTAITTYALLRKLGMGYHVAVFGSIIYNFLPYHYFRIEHFWLCGTYIIPLALWLMADIYKLFSYEAEYNKRNFIIDVAFSLIIGSNGIYYTVFSALLLMIVAMIQCINEKSVRTLLKSGILTGVMFVPVIVGYVLPAIVKGSGQISRVSAVRGINQLDVFGLRIFSLFLPIPGHRLKVFSDFTENVYEELSLSNEAFTASLGFIMSLGLVISILGVLCKKVFRSRLDIVEKMGILNIIIIFVSSVGGMSDYIGIFLSSSIRCYNRMSIFIALNSIICICILLEHMFRKGNIYVNLSVLVLGVIIGVLDQTSPAFHSYSFYNPEEKEYMLDYESKEKDYYELQSYLGQIEQMVGKNANIYQMPETVRPDSKDKGSTVKIKGYTCSETLHWSFSDDHGYYDAWKESMENLDFDVACDMLALLDMQGILLYKNSYSSDEEFNRVKNEIEDVLNMKPLVGMDNTLYFYDLRKVCQERLEGYSEAELELCKRAIRNDILGVNIQRINLSKLYVEKKELSESDILHEGQVQYGPYIDLDKGIYQVTIMGKGLSDNNFAVTAGMGGQIIKISSVDSDDECVVYQFSIEKKEKDVEFILNSSNSTQIINYYLEKDTGSGFHDVQQYVKEQKVFRSLFPDKTKNVIPMNRILIKEDEEKSVKKEERVLRPGGLLYGPYIQLLGGNYRIDITGKNFKSENLEIWAANKNGKEIIPISDLEVYSDRIEYTIHLDGDKDSVELLIKNKGTEDIIVYGYSYEKNADLY